MTKLLPDAVQWHEGMMMSPHHFQQNDIYWQEHLCHRLRALHPHSWGLLHLRYSLINNMLRISEVDCILPDGLSLQCSTATQNGGTALEYDASGKCDNDGAPLRLWLWVRARGAAGALADDPERRYNPVLGARVSDENTGGNEMEIERLQVQFKLHLSALSPSDDSACPLLELRRVDGTLRVTAYHPPMLRLDASTFHGEQLSLLNKLARLNQSLWSRVGELAGGGDDGIAPEAVRRLAGCLPLLSASLDAKLHPARLYPVIAQLVGQASSIGTQVLPLYMHPYQHDNCMPQFQLAFDFIRDRLALLESRYQLLPFTLDAAHAAQDMGRFELLLPASADGTLIIALKGRGNQTEQQMAAWLEQAVIVGAALAPMLEKSRFQGAVARPLTARERQQCLAPAQLVLRAIDNLPVTPQPGAPMAFAPGQPLLISGPRAAQMPAQILLYQQRAAAPGEAAPVHD
ncbi:type VI secretion system baseplate subunit TssK [Janthinobacterium sp. PC23-8]|uniref:type VI secretion system baseplate subunit TssK n=1 Tax=Janthinobacterium sp. PC23-8 TaxID=2012679 RepID=UPI001595C6A3|nr:type VI secretion system baseplate subunit TssK [Janthinobacterium sp. PC23-8]